MVTEPWGSFRQVFGVCRMGALLFGVPRGPGTPVPLNIWEAFLMTEPVDIYCDVFQINLGPFGCALNFALSPSTPPAPGAMPQPERKATVRMSLEHAKVMTFIMRRHLAQYEQQAGARVEIPIQVLNQLQIGSEDWNSFWR